MNINDLCFVRGRAGVFVKTSEPTENGMVTLRRVGTVSGRTNRERRTYHWRTRVDQVYPAVERLTALAERVTQLDERDSRG